MKIKKIDHVGVAVRDKRKAERFLTEILGARITFFQMAEVAVPERLFRLMLSRIHRPGRACQRAPALSL